MKSSWTDCLSSCKVFMRESAINNIFLRCTLDILRSPHTDHLIPHLQRLGDALHL